MARALWNGAILADSQESEIVDGDHYPPRGPVSQHLLPSAMRRELPGQGRACYFHIEVDGKLNALAAWTHPEPDPSRAHIKNYVAFWKGVLVQP